MDNRTANAAQKRDEIKKLLLESRLAEALQQLFCLLDGVTDWSVRSRYEEIDTAYRYMLQFYGQGAADNQRQTLYRQLIAKALLLADDAYRAAVLPYSMLLADQTRRERLNRSDSYQSLGQSLKDYSQNRHDPDLQTDSKALDLSHERTLSNLFAKIWTSGLWTASDREDIAALLDSPEIELGDRCVAVSAVSLALMEQFDPLKMTLLGSMAGCADASVSLRALTGFALACRKYENVISFFPEIQSLISLMADSGRTLADIRSINAALLLSSETQDIDRRMREEIMPIVMKNPKLGAILTQEDIEEVNPDWADWFEKSEVKKGLQEMTELQFEGADVYMSTFAQLKNYDFFRKMHNWFRPFDDELPCVVNAFRGQKLTNVPVGKALLNADLFCNSDKYSFSLTFNQIPETQRDNIISQLSEEVFSKMADNPAPDFTAMARQYIQDLYRFYKVYPRRHEFSDPFTGIVDLTECKLLEPLVHNSMTENLTAEFLFKKSHWKEAGRAFARVISLGGSDSADYRIYQKAAYSCQKSGAYASALELLGKADLLEPDNLWTLRHTAQCQKLLSHDDAAAGTLQHALQLAPDDRQLLLLMADCHVSQSRFSDALAIYYKVDYLKENYLPALRGIAWCSFINDDPVTARRYYSRILESGKPVQQDYLNAGHVELCSGNIPQAVKFYKTCLKNLEFNDFESMFHADLPVLQSKGFNSADLPLLHDLLRS